MISETSCHLATVTCGFRDKRASKVVGLALHQHCSAENLSFWSKRYKNRTFTILSITLHKHLLEQLDDILKGSSGLFKVLIFELLWTLTIFLGNIRTAIFCCIQQGECLTLLVEGVSILHCESYPGQEQSFLWLGSLGSTPLLRNVYCNFISNFIISFFDIKR